VTRNNTIKKYFWIDYLPMAATAILIIVVAFWKQQSFIKTLPTLITLVVQILLARANRTAFLLGGANSLLYAISYLGEMLYFQAFYAVAISMPLQVYTYFNWKKNSTGNKPNLRELYPVEKLLTSGCIILLWLLCDKFIGEKINSDYASLDILLFLIGVAVTVLSAIRYVDARYLSLVSCIIDVCLWVIIAVKDPKNINYVIISVYNLYRGVETLITWSRLTKNKTASQIHKKNNEA